jgi:hypothetical protein
MIQHKPIRKPPTCDSYLQKGSIESLMLGVDVDATPKGNVLVRCNRPESVVKGYRSAKGDWAELTLRIASRATQS